jgi:hypothetical protein
VVRTGCYSWRSKQISGVVQGFHQCQRGRLLACLQAGVLVIDGKIRVCSDGKTRTMEAHGGEETVIFGSH